jgi:hypothetical protein
VELTEMFAVLPAFRSVYEEIAYDYSDLVSPEVHDAYISSPANAMSLEELRNYCDHHNLLAPYLRERPIIQMPQKPLRRAA